MGGGKRGNKGAQPSPEKNPYLFQANLKKNVNAVTPGTETG